MEALNLEVVKETEMSVIGAIIIDEKALTKVIDKVVPDDFYCLELKKAYEAILKLSNEGKPIDFITVLNEISGNNDLIRKEMKELLFICTQTTPSALNADYYAELMHKSSVFRKIETHLLNAMTDTSSENIIEKSENLIEDISKTISPIQAKKMRTLTDVSTKMIDYFLDRTNSLENRIDTGYSKIDNILQGMSGGNLIILAARPKVGKTAFALSIAENVANLGKKVIFYSQEMMAEELCERILSKSSGISMNKIINKSLSSNEIFNLKKSLQSKTFENLIINDNSGICAQDMRLECRMIKNLGLIVVDYLQLMRSTKKSENRNQEIGTISRDLKRLATDLNVPILCLSQLNRTSDENKRPSSSELRDSGELEQNCNKLMLMWCVSKNEKFKTIGVDVALNRRGSTGVTLLDFCGERMQFTQLETKYEETGNYSTDWRNKTHKNYFK